MQKSMSALVPYFLTLDCNQSTFLNRSLPTPHRGHTQSSGRSIVSLLIDEFFYVIFNV